MTKSLIKKIGILFGVFLFATGILLNSSLYAATIGQTLTSPETGWQRFDDTDSNFHYVGTWGDAGTGSSAFYGGSVKFVTKASEKDSVKFKFFGTKLRIIAQPHTSRTNNIQVKIDNKIIENYSLVSPVFVNQSLVYERTGLDREVHSVELLNLNQTAEFIFDAIDIDEDGKLINVNVPTSLKATPGDKQAGLSWDMIKDAESYTVKYGIESGKYTETVTASKDAYGNFVIPGLTNGTKYYFVVSAKVNGVDSEYSNEASATPQGGGSQPDPEQPTGNRAILVVTMTTGLEKEFDLSMKEVNDFIAWYEGKQAGTGSASYAINKHDNNKGPFSSRKDYILYDRVLTFEVSEYTK